MTPLPVPSLPDRLRAHAHLHPESAELLREAADEVERITAWLGHVHALLIEGAS